MLFTTYAHKRGGANPNFGRYHRIAIRNSLNGRKLRDALNDPHFRIEV